MQIRSKGDVMLVTVEGKWDKGTATQARHKTSSMATRDGFKAMLIDLRNAQVLMSVTDIVELTPYLKEDFPHGFRHALVVPDDSVLSENTRFAENLAVNNGINLRMFSDYEKAISWLAGE